MYIELHTASAFSFLEGASLPERLAERAAELGYPALALLDRDGVYGIPRFHLAAKKLGVRALVGAELTISTQKGSGGFSRDGETGAKRGRPLANRHSIVNRQSSPVTRLWRLPVLVATREGYRNLCRLITRMKLRAVKGEGAFGLEELDGHTTGLVALAGRAALDPAGYGVGGLLDRLVGLFGAAHVYVELQRHLLRDEEADNQALGALASAFHVPVVATGGVRFATEAERPLYDVLTCIRHQTTLSRAGRRLTWNAERYLKSPEIMARLFSDLPEALAESRRLAERLEFTMADLGYRFPDYPVPAGETQASFLRKMAEVGARDRYRPYHGRARAQIARELDLIEKLELAGYFLIVWDIVNYCRQNGILVQGRGSAANSAVCYSLGITAVDPIAMDLLFERFLSEERGEWPDIDLDLPSGDRREQAIQYVYERYGQLGAAMTANVITYRARSAAREVGKALEMEAGTIDRMARAMSPFEWQDPKETLARHLADAGLDPEDRRVRIFGDLWMRIQDLPRHLGQHSGGMVICQGRLDEVVPLEPASMPGRVVVQWDKEDCADMGIVKVDLLGLGMMAVLQDALTIVNASRAGDGHRGPAHAVRHEPGTAAGSWRDGAVGEREPEGGAALAGPAPPVPDTVLDLARLPSDDPVVYRMLQEADTIGVFQVESRAQMATLPRLRPRCFYDIVVEVAIIRPGPIVGRMVHPYLKRRNGQEQVSYPHPSLEPILKRTLGVPLFQEQLLRMAMVVAGFTGGEAEELRRAMGFKRSEARMRQIEQKLRTGMAARGITGEAAEEIVRSITSFALYGFPESHAASFALLVYASAYLKAHFPAAFYAALLNNQPMGFYHPATLVKDGQRRGVRFTCIDVQESDWLCRVEEDGSVRLGLCFVRGLRQEVGERIAARRGTGPARGSRLAATGQESWRPVSAEPAGGQTEGVRADGKRLPLAPGRESGPVTPKRADEPSARASGCPKCGADDETMLECVERAATGERWFCNVCSHDWLVPPKPARGSRPAAVGLDGPHAGEAALERLVASTGLRRDEVTTLAEIGALNAFGFDRRGALWQVERVVRPAGVLFEEGTMPAPVDRAPEVAASEVPPPVSPLAPMTPLERVIADYAGTGLSVGPHPMALRRQELALRGVLRAADLPRGRAGRRVRIAGAVITRQRPGTAKGFVFLTLEDETGISNVIIRPDLFLDQRRVIVREPFVIVEGILQQQEGVTSVRAERVLPLGGARPAVESHDFH
jgi:error-prone DNA polymerase